MNFTAHVNCLPFLSSSKITQCPSVNRVTRGQLGMSLFLDQLCVLYTHLIFYEVWRQSQHVRIIWVCLLSYHMFILISIARLSVQLLTKIICYFLVLSKLMVEINSLHQKITMLDIVKKMSTTWCLLEQVTKQSNNLWACYKGSWGAHEVWQCTAGFQTFSLCRELHSN